MTEPLSDERLAEIRAGDFVRSLITAAEYDCYDKFEDRFISPPEKHPASEAARIILGLLSRLDRAEAGWQPMASAPKDGENILATDANCYSGFPQVVYWDEGWHQTDANIIYADGFFTHWRRDCLTPPPSET